MNVNEIADKLATASYGAPSSVDLDDGRTIALRVEIDYDSDIRDCDTFGTFSKFSYDYGDPNGRTRPDDMNGNAEKLQIDRGAFVWWQPPSDIAPRGTDAFRAFRAGVQEVAESGYVGFVVEVRDGTDAVGRPHAIDAASLWGVEACYDADYAAEVVRDLLSEVGITE